jgi:hypothetical protein
MIAIPAIKLPDKLKYLAIGGIFLIGTYQFLQSASGWESLLTTVNCSDLTCIYFTTTKMHSDRQLAIFSFMISLSFFVWYYFEAQKHLTKN